MLWEINSVHENYALLDALPLGIFIIDANFVVRYWNLTLEDWTGINRETIVGERIGHYFPHLQEPLYTTRFEDIFNGGPPAVFSAQLHKQIIPCDVRTDVPRTQHTTVTAVPGENDTHFAMFSIQDVTDSTHRIRKQRELRDEALREVRERERAEAALKEGESRYRILSELMSDFAFSFRLKDNKTYVCEWITEAFTYITGHPTAMFQSLEDWQRMVHPEDHDEMSRVFNTLFVAHADAGFAHRIITQQGEVRYLQTYLHPVMDVSGKRVTQIVGAAKDITVRKHTEIRLQESEERFRQIAEHDDSVIYLYDVETDRVQYVNPTYEHVIQRASKWLYRNRFDYLGVVHPDDVPAVKAALMSKNPLLEMQITYRVMLGNQEMRWLDQRRYPIYNRQGKLIRFVVLIDDVTERKRAAEQEIALELNRQQVALLASFITDAGHEFRTPLSIINTSAHLLEHQLDTTKRERHINNIRQQVNAIDHLVNQLVLMVRLDSPAHNTKSELFDLNSVISAVNVQNQRRMADAGLTFELQPTKHAVMIAGRPEDIGRAINALVDNARLYTPAPGGVFVHVETDQTHAVVAVRDTGLGIAPEDHERVFKRFYRSDEAHTTRGFGLGLPITRKIIEAHGGTLTLKSAVNEGSTFFVKLPLAQ